MTGSGDSEIIITYFANGRAYRIAHWGTVNPDHHWGELAVFDCGGRRLADFTVGEAAMLEPEHRPAELPYTNDDLIAMAQQAVREAASNEVAHAS